MPGRIRTRATAALRRPVPHHQCPSCGVVFGEGAGLVLVATEVGVSTTTLGVGFSVTGSALGATSVATSGVA